MSQGHGVISPQSRQRPTQLTNSQIQSPNLLLKSASQVLIKTKKHDLMRFSARKPFYPGHLLVDPSQTTGANSKLSRHPPNEDCQMRPSEVSRLLASIQAKSPIQTANSQEEMRINEKMSHSEKLRIKLKIRTREEAPKSLYLGSVMNQTESRTETTGRNQTTRSELTPRLSELRIGKDKIEEAGALARKEQPLPKNEDVNMYHHFAQGPQKLYIPKLALSPTNTLLTEMLASNASLSNKFSTIPKEVLDQCTTASRNFNSTQRKKDDPEKARVKLKLKKAAFPAILAKQKATRHKNFSLASKKHSTEGIDLDDLEKLYEMKKEKHVKRTKLILTLDTYNINSLKQIVAKSTRNEK